MHQFYDKILIVRPFSAARPSSVTDKMTGRYHTISGYSKLLPRPPTQVFSYKDGLGPETGPKIKVILWDWHIIHPTSHHDENSTITTKIK